MEVDNEIIDDILGKNYHVQIAKSTNLKYSITNYGIYSDNGFVCHVGSDIIDADNVANELRKLYPDRHFNITEEYLSIG